MPLPKIAHKLLESMAPSDLITHTVKGRPVSQKWLLCIKSHNTSLEKKKTLCQIVFKPLYYFL